MDPIELKFRAGRAFTPSAPIIERTLFAGRAKELDTLFKACGTPGGHAILFGERGVGKTSLANVFTSIMGAVSAEIRAAKVTCSSGDTYQQVVRKLLRQVDIPIESARTVGFMSERKEGFFRLDHMLAEDEDSPEDLRFLIDKLRLTLVLVIDEFDRLSEPERVQFADAVKVFSDNATSVTVVLVGVAHSVDDLVSAHQSTQRALSQVRVERMGIEESIEIVAQRLPLVEMTAADTVVDAIARLSQGLPHFVHLLGLETVLAGVADGASVLDESYLRAGLRGAIQSADQSIVRAYVDAVQSPRVDALFAKVLCACAMAETDLEGCFRPRSVLPHLQRVHPPAKMSTFMKHLNTFSTARGPVLEQLGSRRKYRFRFRNPMMRAYVLIQAVASGDIQLSDVEYIPSELLAGP